MIILQATNINKCDHNIESKVTPERVKAPATGYCQTKKIKSKINPLSANPTKWSNTLKQFVRNLPTKCLSVFENFVILTLKGLSTKNITSNGTLNTGTLLALILNVRAQISQEAS